MGDSRVYYCRGCGKRSDVCDCKPSPASDGYAFGSWRGTMKSRALDLLESGRWSRDSDRLDWLLQNVSGAEFRRLGIIYSAGCTRDDIDKVRA